ncbi:MAG: hypothetical protein K2R93_02980 [Gemmatimonadaceae bacterium]|nr:hypothetical protein [Gemmatimonadaceae bacterium]
MPLAHDDRDLTVNWPTKSRRRLSTVLENGRFKLPYTPQRCRPGARVYLAGPDGEVLLSMQLKEIVKNEGVRGSQLIARKGTVRKPRAADFPYVPINSNAEYAPLYLWPGTTQPDYESYPGNEGGGALESRVSSLPSLPLLADNAAKKLRQPERALIKAYTQWIGRPEIFSHRRLPEPGLYTDLFVSSTYTLVEAKAWVDRETLRMSIGQLYDYQRYFLSRHPSLAVLLPRRPSVSMMNLFQSKKIAVVWRSRGKAFSDSVGGRLTVELKSTR